MYRLVVIDDVYIVVQGIKALISRLKLDYDEKAEILTVRTDEVLLNRFREQKSLVEIAGKYEGQYAERYKKFIEIVE